MKILTWFRIAWDAVTDAFVETALFVDEFMFGVAGEETRRAEGTQHAQTPGEVSGANSPDPSPCPGDLTIRDVAHTTETACGVDPTLVHARLDQVEAEVLRRQSDSELLARAVVAVERAARTTPRVLEINYLLNLADALRDRAAQFAALEALGQE